MCSTSSHCLRLEKEENLIPEKKVIIYDEFYPEPHAIRDIARDLNYYIKPNANYPGVEAHTQEFDWEEVRGELIEMTDDDCGCPGPKDPPFLQGKFRLALAADSITRPDLVHQDAQSWSGVIYLTLPAFCTGGVSFYRDKLTGAEELSLEWEEEVFGEHFDKPKDALRAIQQNYMKNPNNWHKIGEIPMKFNRLLLLQGHCFHGSTGVFGDSFDNGRLTQHFELYKDTDRRDYAETQ